MHGQQDAKVSYGSMEAAETGCMEALSIGTEWLRDEPELCLKSQRRVRR